MKVVLRRTLVGLFVGSLVLFTLVSTTFRVLLINLDDAGRFLTEQVHEAYGAELTLDRMHSEWRGIYPSIHVEGLGLSFAGDAQIHRFEQINVRLDLWRSLLTLRPVLDRLTLVGGSVALQHREGGRWEAFGVPLDLTDPGGRLRVSQLAFRDLSVMLYDLNSKEKMNLGTVDLDVNYNLFDTEVLVRNDTSGDLRFEFQAQLDNNETYIMFRSPEVELDQLMPWIGDYLPAAADSLPASLVGQVEVQLAFNETMLDAAAGQFALTSADSKGVRQESLHGSARWRLWEDGFGVSIEHLALAGETVMTESYFGRNGQMLDYYVKTLDLQPLHRLLTRFAPPLAKQWPVDYLTGHIQKARGRMALDRPQVHQFHGQFRDLSVDTKDGRFKVSGLSGEVGGADSDLYLNVEADLLHLEYPAWYAEPLALAEVEFEATVRSWNEDWSVELERFSLHDPMISLRSSGWLSGGSERHLHLDANIAHIDLTRGVTLLPTGMIHPSDERWLRQAVRTGRLQQAQLRLNGPLSDLLESSQAEVTLVGRVEKMDLDYQPGWPMFRDIRGMISVDKKRLSMILDEVSIQESKMRHGSLLIEDLTRMDLWGSGILEGPLGDIPEYLQFAELTGPALTQQLQFIGPARTEFTLHLPLDNRIEDSVDLRGHIHLHNNTLLLSANETGLTAIKGDLEVMNQQLRGSLEANFNDRPMQLELNTKESGDLHFQAAVLGAPADFLPQAQRLDFGWMTGASKWDITIHTPGLIADSDRQTVAIEARTDLKGVRINLPGSLGKLAATERFLDVQAELKLDGSQAIRINHADQIQINARTEATQPPVASVVFGDTAQPVPQAGVEITGQLAKVDIGQWMDWQDRHSEEVAIWPRISALQVDHLHWNGLDIDEVEISLSGPAEAMQWDFKTALAKGQATLMKDQPVKGRLEYLYLDLLDMAASDPDSINPGALPPLDFEVEALQWRGYRFEDIQLQTHPQGPQLVIDHLRLDSRHFSADLTGYWGDKDGLAQTLLRGTAHTDNIEKTLNYWAIDTALRDGELDLDLAIQWPGPPWAYDLKKLQGSVGLKGKDGRIRQMAPELARVLALLNLERIFARLSLDFDDVLRGGFSYGDVEGSFDFLGGSLYTKSLRIVGPSAQFLIHGRIGMVPENYDLEVVATPETDVLLPVAAGAVAGPIGLVGVYLGNQLLELFGGGINQVTAVRHHVTGSWDEPVIVEVPVEPAESDS